MFLGSDHYYFGVTKTLVKEENIGGQFRKRDYLWMKPGWALFGFLQNLDCIGSSTTGHQRHHHQKTFGLIVNHDLFLRTTVYII